jgi:hypothetical protein
MRWDNLTLPDESAQGTLFEADDVITRTFDTPEFRGMTFYEVRARSVLNKVPGGSRMPFDWTLNPYRAAATRADIAWKARRRSSWLPESSMPKEAVPAEFSGSPTPTRRSLI